MANKSLSRLREFDLTEDMGSGFRELIVMADYQGNRYNAMN